jgi:glutathione synthase/RimK-type ligase-like ATP-grasp enzyme
MTVKNSVGSTVHTVAMWVVRHNVIPKGLRQFIQRHTGMLDVRAAKWIAKDPYVNDPPVSAYQARYPYTLGIIKELWHGHYHYIAACRELGVAYKVLDISGPDWLRVIDRSDCDAFLVRPSVVVSIWRQMYDERLRVLAHDLGKTIFPSYDEIWFYESKRRMHYWLEAHGVPHPKTWVFYDLSEALAFADRAELPIVYKSDLGSGASGVRIFSTRESLRRHIRRCFSRGVTSYRRCRNDKEWGFILLQEYLPHALEWRMLRLGNSYFGHQKLKKGDFHSGSGLVGWEDPPRALLDFAREITDRAAFTSMDLDIFETPDRRYLVNELQALFGSYLPYQMRVNDRPGRYVWDQSAKGWCFEEGIFNQNGSCSLRVQALIEVLRARQNREREDRAK